MEPDLLQGRLDTTQRSKHTRLHIKDFFTIFFLFSEQNGLLNQASLSHHSSTSSMTSSGNVPDVSNQAEEEKSEVEMKSEDRITLGSEKIKDSKGS